MSARLLIINADDLGYDPEVTRGILESIHAGIVSSATLMVNTPHAEEAAAQAGTAAIGLHLNLARHAPVWSGFPPVLLDRGTFVEARAGALPPEVVEREALAQLARLETLVGRPATHVDVHKHLHAHSGVLEGLCAAALQQGLPVRSIDPAMRAAMRARGVLTNDHFLGGAGDEPYWTLPRLRDALGQLPAQGVIELMCHPGYAPQTVRSGYSTQREVELQTFTHPDARALLLRLGIARADFSALRQL